MGCCTLFVISQVESFELNYDEQLDYSRQSSFDLSLSPGCNYVRILSVPDNSEIRLSQQEANKNPNDWRKDDPKRVAEDQLQKIRGSEPRETRDRRTKPLPPVENGSNLPSETLPTETLLETASSPFRKQYEWIEWDRKTRLIIIVSRPYWLKQYAQTRADVIWVPTGSSLLNCGNQKKKRKR